MSRIKLQMNKKQNSNSALKREAAQLLREGKEAQAKLSVENLFRQENINRALSQLEVICEHVLARFDALNMTSHPPPDLHGALCSIIFAGPRVDIQELRQLAQNFELKYGKEFVQEAMSNKYNTVHEKILESLSMARPKQAIIDALLLEIAQDNKIDWAPDDLSAARAALKLIRPGTEDETEEIPEDIPEPALDDDELAASDRDLWREFEAEQRSKNQPDLMLIDDNDEIPAEIPAPNFGVAPSKPLQFQAASGNSRLNYTSSQSNSRIPARTSPAAATAPSRQPGSAAPASRKAAPVQQEPDDFDLDLPEVPISPPKPHFSCGDGGNGGGGDLEDLDNLLPQVPPTDPHNHIGSKSTNFGAGSGFGSSMASLARKPSASPGGASKPNNSSNSNSSSSTQNTHSNASPGGLDDDDLMARFRRLRDSN